MTAGGPGVGLVDVQPVSTSRGRGVSWVAGAGGIWKSVRLTKKTPPHHASLLCAVPRLQVLCMGACLATFINSFALKGQPHVDIHMRAMSVPKHEQQQQ